MPLHALVVAVLLTQATQPLDTVYLANGGRLRGTVVEDTASGIAVLMPDGTTRQLPRIDVSRVEYAPRAAPAPAPVPAPAPAPAAPAPAAPAPGSEPAPPHPPQPCPPCPPCPACAPCPTGEIPLTPPRTYAVPPPGWTPPPAAVEPEAPPAAYAAQAPLWTPPRARRGFQASLGVQYALGGGEVLRDLDQDDVHPVAVELEAHLGFKVSRRWFVGAYVGGGPGVPGEDTRDLCEDADVDCHTESGRVGLMLRLDLKPDDAGNVWIALGGGVERHRVDVAAAVPGSGDPAAPVVVQRGELELEGVEPVRLMAGIDFRSTRVFGVGVYAALSFGRYRDVSLEDGAASTLGPAGVNLAEGSRATHTWFTVGVRGILFP